MSNTTTLTLHELALNNPEESATKHILVDAERIPEKIMELLKGKMPFKVEKPFVSEKYTIRSCKWASNPDQAKAIKEQRTLTRDLEISIEFKKNGVKKNLSITLPNIPTPCINGSYIYGENTKSTPGEYYFTRKLIQKPGIFPINLEENKNNNPNYGIVFESPEITTIQAESELLIYLKSTNLSKYQKQSDVIKIPKELWGKFDTLIREARTNSYIKWENHTEIEKIIKKGFGFKDKENARCRINEWIEKVSNQKIPEGSWQKRFKDHPFLSKNTPWDFTKSDKIDKLLKSSKDLIYLNTNSLGLKYLETASDITAQIIVQEIFKCLNQNKFTGKELKTHAFEQDWENIPWSDILASRCILEGDNKQQNQGATPADMAMISGKIVVINNPINPEGLKSNTERVLDSSFKGAIASSTLENSEVGRMHYLCKGAKVDPITKEILRPVKIIEQTKEGPNIIEKYMSCEEIEELEKALKKQTRHELKTINLDQNIEVPQLNTGEIYAFFKMSTEDYLPLELSICPNLSSNAPARYMVLSGLISATVATEGSTIDTRENETSSQASRIIANNGEILYSPVSGTVKSIDIKDPKITIETKEGDLIDIPYYSNHSNSFEWERGLNPTVTLGQEIKKGQIILKVDNNSVTPEGNLTLGVPNLTVQMGGPVEDDYKMSENVCLSGRYTFRTIKTISSEGLHSGGSITLSNSIQPGTLIKEGDILGTRTVIKEQEPGKPHISEEVPWIASSKETGILKSVNFIDKDLQNSTSFSLHIEPSALEPINIYDETMPLLNIDIQEFHSYMANWNVLFQNECENFNINLKPLYESIEYEILVDDEWVKKNMDLSQLTTNSEKIKELLKDLSLPDREFKADISYSTINERICRNTRNNIQKVIHLQNHHISVNDIPKKVNLIQFQIEKFDNVLKTGSKLACPNGTKGTAVIVPIHEMPIVNYNGKYRTADAIGNILAILARGSTGAIHNEGISNHTQEVFMYQEPNTSGARGVFIGVTGGVSNSYLYFQGKQNPDKSNYLGITAGRKGNAKGVKMDPAEIEPGVLLEMARKHAAGKSENSLQFLDTFNRPQQNKRELQK